MTTNGAGAARAVLRLAAAGVWTVLAACGSDDNDAPPTVRGPLPALVEDTLPAGTRIDARNENYFPYATGDAWAYTAGGTLGSVAATRTVTSGPDGTGRLTVREAGPAVLSRDIDYLVSADGVVLADPLGAALGSPIPAAPRAFIGVIAEYPQPFFAIGGTRRHVRQGTTGEDTDFDGRPESFRAEFTQTFRGFETIALPNGRTSAQAAHFSNAVVYTLVPSSTASPIRTIRIDEEAWFAPGIGLVRSDRTTSVDGNLTQRLDLAIRAGTVGGVALFADGTSHTVPLVNAALVYSRVRNRYYASVPGSVAVSGNRIAAIDPQTGAVVYSPPVGSDPGPLAVAPDGSTLYVGLAGAGQVVRLDAATLNVIDSLTLPPDSNGGPLFAESLSVSPADPAVAVVALRRPNVSPRHAGVVLLRNMVVQPVKVQNFFGSNLVAFNAAGSEVVGLVTELSDYSLVRLSVLPDGLASTQSAPGGLTNSTPISFAVAGSLLIAGQRVFRTGDLVLTGTVAADGGGCRAFAGGQRVVCLHHAPFLATETRLTVADLSTFVIGATPLVSGLPPPSSLTGPELVPGPAGQVALRHGLDLTGQPSSHIVLFDSPLLQ